MDDQKLIEMTDLIRSGKIRQAMNLLIEEQQKDPTDWSAHYHMGMAWRLTGDLDKAISSYKKAIQLCPDNDISYTGLGVAYQLKGDYDHAIENLKKAVELDKNSVHALNSLGLTYKKKGDIAKALEIYEYAADVLMKNIFSELRQSGNEPFQFITNENDKKTAVMDINFMELVPSKLKQDDLYCTLQNNIGVCYAESGEFEKARNAFKEAIEFTTEDMDFQAPIIGLRNLMDEF